MPTKRVRRREDESTDDSDTRMIAYCLVAFISIMVVAALLDAFL